MSAFVFILLLIVAVVVVAAVLLGAVAVIEALVIRPVDRRRLQQIERLRTLAEHGVKLKEPRP
jgi:hypothetical protein